MVTRREWLEAGLELLAAEGAPAVTIERLTGKLGVTKGSYYHHFTGTAGFRTALLEYFEAQFTMRLIDSVEREPGTEPWARLQHLLKLVLSDPDSARLEIAVRAWALQDAEARAAQERVDRTRTDYLRELCRGLKADVDADRLAQLLYLILIGSEQVLPPVPTSELREIYAMTLLLATGETLSDEEATHADPH
ncbi:TetR/AcrR family transcriptional regulator [Kribbella turkmenica]|uniref:TetR/AcrR family transcriptional regulator n=1 Tax=Kribbella turkmenica TaxID=2530375 RepID=A0A4R4XIR2_9ACTN|nr:TetR/AcrR family transcriptional regulator [Kribbella turkmenica]TDD30745.1 TetR/AcrR family transcriptional regulator [Kribbella turkmenica]